MLFPFSLLLFPYQHWYLDRKRAMWQITCMPPTSFQAWQVYIYIQRIMEELKGGPEELRNSLEELVTYLINGHIAKEWNLLLDTIIGSAVLLPLSHPLQTDLFLVMRHLSALHLLKASSSVKNQLEITWKSLVFLLDACHSSIKSHGSFFTLFCCIFALLQLAFPDYYCSNSTR